MRKLRILGAVPFAWVLFCCLGAAAAPVNRLPYERLVDVPYGEAKGETLYMDIFIPTGENRLDFYHPNDNGWGLGIIDVVSGGWNGSRARMGEHEQAGMFNIFAARGYTIFAIRPGSLPKFDGFQLVENLERGIRWVKEHAAEYKVDPDRLGIVGASAGGHLASLASLQPKPGQPDAADPILRHGTAVKAAGVLFPPTDFLTWDNGSPVDANREPYLMFNDGIEGKSEAEILEVMRRLSPVNYVHAGAPPFILVHGDADPIVPLAQSEVFAERLRAAGIEAELYVKEGGGHFWLTIPEEIVRIADWLDIKLRE